MPTQPTTTEKGNQTMEESTTFDEIMTEIRQLQLELQMTDDELLELINTYLEKE